LAILGEESEPLLRSNRFGGARTRAGVYSEHATAEKDGVRYPFRGECDILPGSPTPSFPPEDECAILPGVF